MAPVYVLVRLVQCSGRSLDEGLTRLSNLASTDLPEQGGKKSMLSTLLCRNTFKIHEGSDHVVSAKGDDTIYSSSKDGMLR